MISFLKNHKKFSLIGLGVFALPAVALAAWLLYSGVSGSVGGKAGSDVSTVGAITLTADNSLLGPSDTINGPNSDGAAAFHISNPSDKTQTITTLSVVGLSGDATCLSHLTFNLVPIAGNISNNPFPAGYAAASVTPGVWHADSTFPSSCAGQSFGATLTGTTTGS